MVMKTNSMSVIEEEKHGDSLDKNEELKENKFAA